MRTFLVLALIIYSSYSFSLSTSFAASCDFPENEPIIITPNLATNVCIENYVEKLNFTVCGKIEGILTSAGFANCICLSESKTISASVKIEIFEDDIFARYLIASKTVSTQEQCCLPNSFYFYYNVQFKDIDLSNQFGFLEGDEIELYVEVSLINNDFIKESIYN